MRHRAVQLLPCLLVLAACGRTSQPVARLTTAEHQLEFPHGRMVPLELRWEPSRPLPAGARPVAFVHLVDAQGNVVRTFDHDLPGKWATGQTLVDRVALYHSAIGPALPPGPYRLVVGLYDGKETRFSLRVESAAELHHQEYVLAQVTVPEVSPTAPAFTFSSEWLAPEPGGDRQAVARRWLSGDGTLELRGLGPPARVWMLLRIPAVEPPLRLVLEPGMTQAIAHVTADCGGAFSADVAGEGFHELTVPVRASEPCRVAFDTNYSVVEMGTGRKLSLALEQLGWQPGDAAPEPAAAAP